MLITPAAYSAGTYDPGPADTPAPAAKPVATASPTPTPAVKASSDDVATPKPAASASPTQMVVAATVQSEIARVSAIIGAGDYKSARAELLKVNKVFPNDANVNNLLGYTSRKLGQYTPSAAYYKKALAINPKHLGALEYQGELYVTLKQFAAARANLKKLGQLCGVDCAEYKDLKLAIGKKR